MFPKKTNPMHIGHIAIWTRDLEAMKLFYTRFFAGQSSKKYVNTAKQFESYFISFGSGASLELMHKPTISNPGPAGDHAGIAHIAFTLGSVQAVLDLTETLRADGYTIAGEPRTTGDGFFESVVLDVEGNRIELVA
jgi:catechol 2,3-dioxygenase-like lactoylglutathione lyase family enzyme